MPVKNYPELWRVSDPKAWPSAPTGMTFSLLSELEECPRRWALGHAEYPEIWIGPGYPPRMHLPILVGNLIHSAIETITRALAHEGCQSAYDAKAVEVMKNLGGYTNLIEICMQRALDPYKGNPRSERVFDLIRDSLYGRTAEIRSQVQTLLGRVRLQGIQACSWGDQKPDPASRQRKPISFGIHPEIEMQAQDLGWRGRADLVILSESYCEIVDFKTGLRSNKHGFQMRVYALLWHKDKELNPTSRFANKLTLSYLDGDVDMPPPTRNDLTTLELEIKQRTRSALNALSADPPSAKPHLESCSLCDVRQLCKDYWQPAIHGNLTTGLTSVSQFTDAELTLLARHGTFSWNAAVNVLSNFQPGTNVVLYVPTQHYLVNLAEPHDRLRILNARISVDGEQNSQQEVITLNSMSEAFLVA